MDLNDVREVHWCIESGMLFQSLGTATLNALLPMEWRLVGGMDKRCLSEERRVRVGRYGFRTAILKLQNTMAHF